MPSFESVVDYQRIGRYLDSVQIHDFPISDQNNIDACAIASISGDPFEFAILLFHFNSFCITPGINGPRYEGPLGCRC